MTKKRAAVVWALLVVATLFTLVATLTVWAKRQILSTDAWTNTSAQVLANEQVRTALAGTLVNQLFQNVDVAQEVTNRLPPRAKSAGPIIAAAIQSNAPRAAEAFLASPAAQKAWVAANRRAHKALIRVINGKSGEVTIDEGPLLMRIRSRLGIGAGPSNGKIVLLRSNQIQAVQDAFYVFKALSLFLLLLLVVLYGLVIYLGAPKRRFFLKAGGASLVLVGLIVLAVRRILGPVLVDSLVKTNANRPAGRVVFALETQILRDIAIALVAYGLFAMLAGFLAGPSRLAVAIRRVLAPTFQRGPVVVYGIAFTIFLLFIVWGPTGATRRLLGIVLLGALFMLGIEIWRRQILREFPPDYPGRLGWASLRPEPSPSGSGSDSEAGRVDALERLAKLHTSGVLTDAEYGAEKARVLGETPAVTTPPQPAGP
jgi:hypothetical protein